MVLGDAKPKILLLDDDTSFLDVASFYFGKKLENSVIISTFSDSQSFVDYIQKHCYLPETALEILQSFYSGTISKNSIEQTLKDLADLPAILIIDHQLRNETTNGIEVSNKINEYVTCPYIILFTSQISPKDAIQFHNDDVIDLFVRKDDPDPMDYVYQHISKQLAKLTSENTLNAEDIFGFGSALEDDLYISHRNDLLQEMSYKAYITTSKEGDVSILNINDEITHYSYSKRVFHKCMK